MVVDNGDGSPTGGFRRNSHISNSNNNGVASKNVSGEGMFSKGEGGVPSFQPLASEMVRVDLTQTPISTTSARAITLKKRESPL